MGCKLALVLPIRPTDLPSLRLVFVCPPAMLVALLESGRPSDQALSFVVGHEAYRV